MKTYLLLILLLLSTLLPVYGGEPYCNIRHFDESNGLSQRSVKKIVTDTTGIVWVATWNGLNRFDGHEFAVVRPQAGESARRYSSRYRDLHAMADGSVWCRIDDRIVRLDPATNRFTDIHSDLESQLGKPLELSEWTSSGDNTIVMMKCGDRYLTLDASGRLLDESAERPSLSRGVSAVRKVGDYPGFPFRDQAFGAEYPDGSIWIVTRSGQIAYAPGRGEEAKVIADMGVTESRVRYSSMDADGGVWFCSNQGAHRVEMGVKPFEHLAGENEGRILSACRDNEGRLWVGETDRKGLAIFTGKMSGSPEYVGPDGKLNSSFTSFGHAVYSLTAAPGSGRIWAGCKPDGLFCLTPASGGFEVEKVMDGNIYDLAFDGKGRLWVATIGDGVWRIDSPGSAVPVANKVEGLPEGTSGARRLSVMADSLILVSTTGGLLALNPLTGASRLHITEVDRLSSLGCIAVTDAVKGADGEIYVSTESGGVSLLKGNPMGEAEFIPIQEGDYGRTDVAYALQRAARGLLSVNPGQITLIDRKEKGEALTTTYGDGFWKTHLRFTEMKPFDLGDGRFLFGTYTGGIVTRLDPAEMKAPKVIFTSAEIQGRRDTLLTPASDEIVLGRNERSLTLRFAALDYSGSEGMRYSVSINGGEWSSPSPSRSISLYDLDPGRYDVEVRATDHLGRLEGQQCAITVIVTPKWHETVTARILFWLLVLLVVWGIWMVGMYIRSMKRRQHEILTAYLNLMEQKAAPAPAETEERAGTYDETESPEVSEADREFMQHVIDYVQAHISDPDAGVDDMAAEVKVSRSGLTRKMKSLMGVSPADFLRQSRLKRACSLLDSTDMPVKEIAFDCGFADLNYFGKCFKSAYGVTPTGWRRGER